MSKKISKRYKKLIDSFKVKKIGTIEETIKNVKKAVQQNLTNLLMYP